MTLMDEWIKDHQAGSVVMGAYRQRCIDYVYKLPASMPWCEYVSVLKALSQPLKQSEFCVRELP